MEKRQRAAYFSAIAIACMAISEATAAFVLVPMQEKGWHEFSSSDTKRTRMSESTNSLPNVVEYIVSAQIQNASSELDAREQSHDQEQYEKGKYLQDLKQKLKEFGSNADGKKHELSSICNPLVSEPVVLVDSKTSKPITAMFYAVARRQYGFQFKECPNKESFVYSDAELDISSVDSKALVTVMDSSPVYGRVLQVRPDTGEILGENPGQFKAIRVTDVLRFKDEFLRRNTCPVLGELDRLKYLLQITDPVRLRTTLQKCYSERLENYEESVLRHFFPSPTPPLE